MIHHATNFTRLMGIIMIVITGLLPLHVTAQENIPEKTQRLYENAVKLLENGKKASAEKQFAKILARGQHGRSLFQLSKIESGNDNSSGMMLPKVITAHRLMQEELAWLKNSPGNEFKILKLEELIEESVEMIHTLGGKTPEEMIADENPNFDPDKVSDSSSYPEPESPGIDADASILIGNDGNLTIDSDAYLFFPQGSVSTYFLINEMLPDGTRLPTEAELEKVLMNMLSTASGKKFLTDQYKDDRKTLKFVSDSLFYDYENNQLVKGFQLKKDRLSLEATNIEPGDSAVTFLIITP